MMSGAQFSVAQTTNTQMSVLHFTFRDSARGTVVRPEAVLVDGKMTFNTIDEAGRMSVSVPVGDHQVLIKATGFDDMDSRQTASIDQAPMNVVLLDPTEEPEELLPEKLAQGMPADGTVIAGFVTDESVGKPLSGAVVELVDKNIKTKTDDHGFFKMPLSMPDGKPMPDDPRGVLFGTRNIRISMPGYGFEERLNLLVETGTPRVYQFQMIRGGGGNTVDEAGDRNNLQSSLFGLRNVEPEDPPSSVTLPSADGHTTEGVVEAHNHDHNHPGQP